MPKRMYIKMLDLLFLYHFLYFPLQEAVKHRTEK